MLNKLNDLYGKRISWFQYNTTEQHNVGTDKCNEQLQSSDEWRSILDNLSNLNQLCLLATLPRACAYHLWEFYKLNTESNGYLVLSEKNIKSLLYDDGGKALFYKMCDQCKQVWYCCKECAREHWSKEHQYNCGSIYSLPVIKHF